MKWLVAMFLLMGIAQAQVCVQSIFPFSSPAQTQTVIDAFAHKGIAATPCIAGQQEPIEVWFYPLHSRVTVGNYFFVSAGRVSGGIVGSVLNSQPAFTSGYWVFAVHPNGGVFATKRLNRSSLKSGSSAVAKWLKKH